MTTERALPTPPVQSPSPTKSSKFSFPSPNKPDPNLKPNPHPYAVKTTTSALLTRSNSSSHNIDATRHYYVPLSPNASRSPESSKGHKTSKSLNAVAESPSRSPRPLPAPPTASGNTSPMHSADASLSGYDADTSFPRRTKRADTLPTFPSEQPSPGLELLAIPDDLPPNPKLWTPAQLSVYLKTALRVTSQAKIGQPGAVPLPIRVAKDIAAFTRSRMITGRMFLRLTEADLESMGMNKKWRELLLATSQELRQNVLKGRIWGEGVSPSPSPGSTSPLPNMFSPSFYASNSSTSSLELSADEGAPAPERPHRSRSGRVRGMVQSFERSGSFSSEASFDGDAEGTRAELGRWLREEQPVVKSPNVSPTRRPLPDPFASQQQAPAKPPVDEEPTMEELLAAEPASAWGARAWEELDGGLGVTIKRVNGVPHPLPPVPVNAEAEAQRTVVGHGRDASSGRRRERDERRVVTAIFTPSPSADDASAQEERSVEGLVERAAPFEAAVQTEERVQAGEVHKEVEETRRLEEELEATRALVDVFRRRLEDVEAKVAELERLEVERRQLERERQEREREERERREQEERERREREERERREREERLAAERAEQAAEPAEELITPGVRADLQAAAAAAAGGDPKDAAGPSTLLARTAAMIPAALHHLENVGSLNRAHEGDDDGEPANLSDLPSYVLLVGFGVCAVVLRVVLRRVAGRTAIVPWRP